VLDVTTLIAVPDRIKQQLSTLFPPTHPPRALPTMSFFGFDATLPRDRGHSSNAPGFGQHDAFAGLGSGGAGDDDVYVAPQPRRC
tara:strand:- start:25135 stop:25389 length:255 start_codon:yes stop_codon:yes gene_type:complete